MKNGVHMMRSSSSSMVPAMAILAIILICCSLPCSAAIQVHTEGTRERQSPPAPHAAPRQGTAWRRRPNTTPPAPAAPHRKTQQQVVPVPPM
ncbi:hypothetical protein ACQJBY_020339 [Aegilops geniculata]